MADTFKVILWAFIAVVNVGIWLNILYTPFGRGRRAFRIEERNQRERPLSSDPWLQSQWDRIDAIRLRSFRPSRFPPSRRLWELGHRFEEIRADDRDFQRYVEQFGRDPVPRDERPPPPPPTARDLIAALMGDEDARERVRRSVGPT